MKNNFTITGIAILIAVVAAEVCDKCILKEECSEFGKLSHADQDAWIQKFPCLASNVKEPPTVFGFAPIAKGDYVCCYNAVWKQGPSLISRDADYNNNYGHQNNYGDRSQNTGNYHPNGRSAGNSGLGNNRRRNRNGWGANQNQNGGGYNNGYGSNEENPDYGNGDPNSQNYFQTNNNPYVTSSPFFTNNGNNGNSNQGGQCPVTSFPPAPETGCCGREAADADRIIGHQPRSNQPKHKNTYRNNQWQPNQDNPPTYGQTDWSPNYGMGTNRVTRSVDDTVNVTIGDRIAGGRETELEQFPWTVLLTVTFDYGGKRSSFNCGGSLLSSRYVLTAGHCVYDEGGKVVDLDVYLAEYDKRTFPKDCKNVLGQGQKCVENIILKAEGMTLHPEYEDSQLKNDIALIRLKGNAPYTDYIRPICLPTIDIDTPAFSNLRLAVAGWGRNGRYRSDVKQSTIVNLVPQEKCRASYPGLSRRNICAAGYTGEDTCKGDSGGPLMTVYGGKYEVVGVVSGKRADSPCGTSVPSLYTNVYHYRDWIRSNMKN